MLAFKTLAGNAGRFKTLMGMFLQEFEFLLVKVERMCPEEERKRRSKQPGNVGSMPDAGSYWICETKCYCSYSTTGCMPHRDSGKLW